jgi:hypothetical protein
VLDASYLEMPFGHSLMFSAGGYGMTLAGVVPQRTESIGSRQLKGIAAAAITGSRIPDFSMARRCFQVRSRIALLVVENNVKK